MVFEFTNAIIPYCTMNRAVLPAAFSLPASKTTSAYRADDQGTKNVSIAAGGISLLAWILTE